MDCYLIHSAIMQIIISNIFHKMYISNTNYIDCTLLKLQNINSE